ncbi:MULTISPECIES: ATP-binding cassette domain-containing protein [Romboutsia]|uniref:ATP-binding cassette domain-containing protein n=1 Tax=Romboutsia TaxID=1501226 RepID=UPI000A909907|nr:MULTISPECIES: ATP-binding cassette domain-containing protein [Romboutsia]MCH1960511.1 ATP-binding cassette domain-containing protein [Romboutsia hominis]MCH1969057.1 ATP-binding cassette domain-containing protein [Romboutsia hominis]MDB8791131.1 ATP-binding cassette domain-containing protein [Romboutsia sp. 1001216sp1]MDB8793451.1 ATP-binding cassette domain-containing protein [Romboutsia sp. 1001216sp1]MDB8796993.1 ATP-binding cassette domain-containing protein [Romboutsia sp. 1001216sp1]
MKEYILKTYNISKKYKKNLVVDNVSISVKRGDIYGFIGQNGAGKTTIMKMITGLVNPSEGYIEIFKEVEKNKINKERKRLGALIETPALYLDMSASENLEVLRIQKGIPGSSCVNEKLKMVGLENTGKKKVKQFSLGMKQRLGIAMALLSDPEILILDEPVNGLDPKGIVEIRDLLKKLNKEKNMTIIISSHLLSELNQVATCYGIINNGKLIEEISQKELYDKCKKALRIKVDDINKAVVCLESVLKTTNFKVLKNNTIKLYDYIDNQIEVSKALISSNVITEEIVSIGDDLEDYFMNLIGGRL